MLTNVVLINLAKKLLIPNFRSLRWIMYHPVLKIECGTGNLDNSTGPSTHWTAYAKKNDTIVYFNNYGNLRPPNALTKVFF